MDEDLLSPLLGRLIDRAKTAAIEAGGESAEAVALLLDDETVVWAAAGPAAARSAAALAVEKARAGGVQEIVAAAVALICGGTPTVLPTDGTRSALAEVDPDLPVVIKQRGRWVVKALSELPYSV